MMTPATLGPYQVLEELGRGAYGQVYRCREAATGRELAVKVLGELAGDAAQRFQREGQALAQLNHPAIVRVHAAGWAGARPYLALELAPGPDLQAHLEAQGPLAPAAACDLVALLAEGVAHAHARGVLHRDIKPENVLLADRPLLVDFGMASLLGSETLTRTGQMLGTPSYMAPEQVAGQWDERSDVYGLGGLLFTCLTARPPITALSLQECLSLITKGPVPDPSTWVPSLPPGLTELCLRCLAKDPAQRYPSASELARALREVSFAPPSKRGPLLALGGLLGCVLGAAGLALATQLEDPHPSPEETQSASATPSAPSASPQRSAAEWAKLGQRHLVAGEVAEAEEAATRALALDPALVGARLLRGRARHARGQLEGALADFTATLERWPDSVEAYYCRAVAERDSQGSWEVAPDLHRPAETAVGLHFRGIARFYAQDLQGALSDFSAALELAPGYEAALVNRGRVRDRLGDPRGAHADFEEALRRRASAVALLERARTHEALGRSEAGEADVQAALQLEPENVRGLCARASFKRLRGDLTGAARDLEHAGKLSPEDPSLLLESALLSSARGELEAARALYRRLLELDPRHPAALNNLAASYIDAGQGARAEPLLRRLLDIRPADSAALSNLAAICLGAGRLDEACIHAQRATEAAPGDLHAGVTYATALTRRGRHRQAVLESERLLAIDAGFARAHYVRGKALLDLGDEAAALAALTRSLELEPKSSEVLRERGALHLRQRRYPDALRDLDRALEEREEARSYLLRGHVKVSLGDRAGALVDYAATLRLDPAARDALNNRVAIHSEAGDFKSALEDAERLVALEPTSAHYRKVQAELLSHLGRHEAAAAACVESLRLAPSDLEVLLLRGQSLQRAGRQREALTSFAALLKLRPDHALGLAHKAVSHFSLGEWRATMDLCDRLLELGGPGIDAEKVRALRAQAAAKLGAR